MRATPTSTEESGSRVQLNRFGGGARDAIRSCNHLGDGGMQCDHIADGLVILPTRYGGQADGLAVLSQWTRLVVW